jgi:hypothetical protein
MKKNQHGFSAVEALLILVIVGLIGFVGWYVLNTQKKTSDILKPVSNSTLKHKAKTTEQASFIPNESGAYKDWKTYRSLLDSGLTFRYPSDWVVDIPTKVFKNDIGGEETGVTLFSREPQTRPGDGAAIPTSEFMCVTFQEYGGKWIDSQLSPGEPLTSESFQARGKSVSLNVYKGDTPMQSVMRLMTNPASSHGMTYISTQHDYYVSVEAEFNCQQGGFPPDADLSRDFNSQPEIQAAKLIMKSITF